MRWRRGRRSVHVEDRRGGGMPRMRMPGGRGLRLGGGATLLVLIIALLMGQDPLQLLMMLQSGGPVVSQSEPAPDGRPPDFSGDEEADFAAAILGDTEDTWEALFSRMDRQYRPPTLVLYDDVVQSACGLNSAATGPFYCPPDRRVYLDLSFFRELNRLGAPGDFARAYVIGHEIGHHVQNLLGISDRVRQLQSRAGSQAEANALSVRLELQADCLAGVWAHHADRQRNLLEEGDLEEGLNAAAAIGDDRLQRSAGRRVNPDSFTHGSSEQRAQWFRAGFEQGDPAACDTFRG